MSLVVQVFTKWRDPEMRAQRQWLFGQMGAVVVVPSWFIFLYIILGVLHVGTDAFQRAFTPLRYVLLALLALQIAGGFAVFGMLPRQHVFRSITTKVVIVQAALLWMAAWICLSLLFFLGSKDWAPLWFLLSAGLIGIVIVLSLSENSARKSYQIHKQETEKSAWLFVIAAFGFALFDFSNWVFLFPVLLCVLVAIKLRRWGRPAAAFCIAKPNIESQERAIPNIPKWQAQVQFLLGGKLTPQTILLSISPLVFLLIIFFFGGTQAGEVFAALLIVVAFGGATSLTSERQIWPYLWLRQIRSRKALWRRSELRFWLQQLLLCLIIAVFMLVTNLDTLHSSLVAAILSMASLGLIRYANLAFPWFSWGKGKSEYANSFRSRFLLLVLWCVTVMLWKNGDLALISWVAVALLLAALIIRRRAKQYILRFDLGALRRNQVL